MSNPKKYLRKEEALKKLQRYCAYQERCHQEVRSKLIALGVYGNTLEEIIAELITENFLNEERFAVAYAGGKFRIKKWGRNKILQEFKKRNISPYCIKKAMQEIEEDDYLKILEETITKKRNQLKETNTFKLKAKLAQHAQQRGFESYLAWKVINELFEK